MSTNRIKHKYTLLSIEAWRDNADGWFWNNWFKIDTLYLSDEQVKPRQLFKLLRELGILLDTSKGKLYLDDDQYNLVICNKGTREPVLALDYGSNWEYNDSL